MIPTISVVTITFNVIANGRKALITKCFNSIYKQSLSNFEHIIIDGASTDGTIDLLREIAHKTKAKIISEPDDGIYNAMNKGISLASGKYISFLNTDDFYHNPKGLEKVIMQMELDESDLSYSDVRAIDSATDRLDGVWKSNLDRLIFGTHFCHQGTVAKRSTLKKYLFDETLTISADSNQLIRMVANNEKITKSKTCFASYRSGGLSNQNPKINRLEHSRSFHKFIGSKAGLSKSDCYNLWNFSIFFEARHKTALEYYRRIQNSKWQSEFLKQHADMIISGQLKVLDSQASSLTLTTAEIKAVTTFRKIKHIVIPAGSLRFRLIKGIKMGLLKLLS